MTAHGPVHPPAGLWQHQRNHQGLPGGVGRREDAGRRCSARQKLLTLGHRRWDDDDVHETCTWRRRNMAGMQAILPWIEPLLTTVLAFRHTCQYGSVS